MTIAELITELSKLDQTLLVAVWNPDQTHGTDAIRLIGGYLYEDIALESQFDKDSINYPVWDEDERHTEAEKASVVVLG